MIVLIIPAYTWFELTQQATLLEFQTDAVATATDLYAENCGSPRRYWRGHCHQSPSELGRYPLNVRTILKTIARGRNDTLMAAGGG